MKVKCGKNEIEISQKNLIRVSMANIATVVGVLVPTITCVYHGNHFKTDQEAVICATTWKRIKKHFHQVQIRNPRPNYTYYVLNEGE